MQLNVRDFGATAAARPAETHELKNLSYKWIRYVAGTKATTYRLAEGATYDSVGIQRAIDAAHQAGGGTVVVPAGGYLIAPGVIPSRVRLHLEPGANLGGTTDLAEYQKPAEPPTAGV